MSKRKGSSSVWNMVQTFSSKAKQEEKCMSDGCSQMAVACWVSNENANDLWNTCESCEKVDFYGETENIVKVDCNEKANVVDSKTAADETNNGEKEDDNELKSNLNEMESIDRENLPTLTTCNENIEKEIINSK